MFRFWAGATASLLTGLLGVSGVSAEGMGSSATPFAGSRPVAANVFADANFSTRYGPANLLGQASEFGTAKAGESTGGLQSFASIDLASTSPFDAGWLPMNSVLNVTSPRALRLTDSRTADDSYFGVLESLSNQGMNGSRAGVGFAAPMGELNSTTWPMR